MERQNWDEDNRVPGSWGGRRAGAGRKPQAGREALLHIRVSARAAANLAGYAQSHQLTKTEALTRLLEALEP